LDDPYRQLTAVIKRGSKPDVEAWVATGRSGVLTLREAVTGGSGRMALEGVHDRDVLDGLATASAAIAERQPDEFLEVFEDPAFDENTFVLTGLGHIDDARATTRLVAAAASRNKDLRMHAAIGLGRRPVPDARIALMGLLADPDFLVRHHASRSLAALDGIDQPSGEVDEASIG